MSASATFLSDEHGRLTNMTAERFDNASKAILPWSIPISDDGEVAGIRVPVVGAGVWQDGRPSLPASGLAKPEPYQR